MVHKKITLIGESNESFEDATRDAVNRAKKTIKNIDWIEVDELSVETPLPENPGEWTYNAEVKIAFEVQDVEDM